ncbi:hypothetical protein VUR80DRAFT_9612 [Thermomyces stellatus]
MSRRGILLTTLGAVLFAVLAMFDTRFIALSTGITKTFLANFTSHSLSAMAQQKAVIVVGSGLAGLTASYEALKAGAPVKMLDRAPKPGGNSIKASSGINGAGTRFQLQRGIVSDSSFYHDSVRSAGRRFREWEELGSKGVVDRASLIKRLTDESRGAVEWLVDELGVDLSVIAPLGGHSVARTHRGAGKTPPGAALVFAFLTKLKENPHFELVSGAQVTALTTKDDNSVTGVEYTLEGQSHNLTGPVMFATGGFAGDANGQLAEYRPDLRGMPATAESRPGTHAMLAAAGAALVDMDSVQIHPTGFVDPAAPDAMSKFLAAEMLRGEGGILLDSEGKRFINELESRDVLSERIMEMMPTARDSGIKLWDVTILLDPGASEAAGSHLGFYASKGLVQKKRVGELDENTIRSLDEYARIVAEGKRDPLGRRNFGHWRLKAGEENRNEEVYIGKITPVVHFTMGGVAFNDRAQVLGEDGKAIGGLYAAGEVTGGLHGDNRLGGSSLLECVVYGRIAGRGAAAALEGSG